MKENVTVVPSDCAVVVNGECLRVGAVSTVSMAEDVTVLSIHAIQWHSGAGHVEFVDGAMPNQAIAGAEDYALWVAPFVTLWEAEKTRIETEQANTEAEALAQYNSIEARAERVRDSRDRRITACDWIMARHAEEVSLETTPTLTTDVYTAWLSYRQALRDLPSLAGFPWDGGGEETPWPTEPVADDVEPAA